VKKDLHTKLKTKLSRKPNFFFLIWEIQHYGLPVIVDQLNLQLLSLTPPNSYVE